MEKTDASRWATVAAGDDLIAFIRLAYQADIPVMLRGPRGVGKSDLLSEAAESMGIDCITLDLSVMEPTDLTGLPMKTKGRTTFAAPLFLPDKGKGLLIIEELNRAPRYMQSPCLQLLTARKINDYHLPCGWLPCAAINPNHEGYVVDDLDEALISRWVNVNVRADESQWALWGAKAGLHPDILDYVQNARPFSDPPANPRAWTYAANILGTWEKSGHKDTLLLHQLLSGVVSRNWAESFLGFYNNRGLSLLPADIINAYPKHRARLKNWVSNSRLDLIQATLWQLRNHLQAQSTEDLNQNLENTLNLKMFFSDIPSDLLENGFDWLSNLSMENFLLTCEQPGSQVNRHE